MSWRRVAGIYAVLAILGAYFVIFELGSPVQEPAADPEAPERSILGIDADAVTGLTFRRGAERVIVTRDADRWNVVEPVGSPVPSDLIAATIATLTAGQVSEELVGNGDLGTFGLARPMAEIEVALRDSPATPLRVLLGDRNPTRTALYAKREDRPAVYLVGLNVRYYVDLIFEAAAR